jgi:hypothetical protein
MVFEEARESLLLSLQFRDRRNCLNCDSRNA